MWGQHLKYWNAKAVNFTVSLQCWSRAVPLRKKAALVFLVWSPLAGTCHLQRSINHPALSSLESSRVSMCPGPRLEPAGRFLQVEGPSQALLLAAVQVFPPRHIPWGNGNHGQETCSQLGSLHSAALQQWMVCANCTSTPWLWTLGKVCWHYGEWWQNGWIVPYLPSLTAHSSIWVPDSFQTCLSSFSVLLWGAL